MIDYLKDFDLVVSYLNNDDHVFAENIRKIGVRNVITYDPLPINDRRSCKSDISLYSINKTHIADHLLKPIISLGMDERDIVRSPWIYVSEDKRAFASDFFSKIGLNGNEKIVAIHPGSGGKEKNWPVQRFREIADYLIDNNGIKLLVISGPADEAVISALLKDIDMKSINVLENIPLPSLAAILERVSCFIGNDSGISHIAAAVGAPSVMIFGPTDPDIWAPRGNNVNVVQTAYPCSPCKAGKMRDCEDQKCLETVEVAMIIKQIRYLLGVKWGQLSGVKPSKII